MQYPTIESEPTSQSSGTHTPVFLTWIAHRRTRVVSQQLNLRLVEIVSPHRGLRRYVDLLWRTTRYVFSERPPVILVQSPSLILTAYVLAIRSVLRSSVIVDAHNEGVQPFLHPSALVSWITRWTHRASAGVIVTNAELASVVVQNGGKPFILPDSIPKPPSCSVERCADRFRVAVVATFADDEPIPAILEAAASMGDSYEFLITGNPAKLPRDTRDALPRNVRLTGYLEETEYWRTLASSHVVVDLTTMDNCLVCGAYEAIAVGTPLVLSDNPASVRLFNGFGEFSDNTAPSIRACLMRIQASYPDYLSSIPGAREALVSEWNLRALELRRTLKQLMDTGQNRRKASA